MTRPRRRLRILALAPQAPWPLDHGGRLRAHHFLTVLARRADVTLAVPSAAPRRAQLPRNIEFVPIPADRSHSSPRGLTWVDRAVLRHFGRNASIDRWLAAHARRSRFDVALFLGDLLGQHICATRLPVVWDLVDDLVLFVARDAQFARWKRWWPATRAAVLCAAFERTVTKRAAATILASTVDAGVTRRFAGGARVETISNGVDAAHYFQRSASPERGTVVFVGSLEFAPNVDGIVHFTRRIWPHICVDRKQRRLLIVGRNPVSQVRELQRIAGVELAANVPDVRPYLARANAVIAPTRTGGGVKNKILEACAARRAVVAGSRALGGLSARPGVEVLRAESPSRWTTHLTRLLDHPSYASRIAEAGYEWVTRTHDWNELAGKLLGILRSVSKTPPPTAARFESRSSTPTPPTRSEKVVLEASLV